jgi:hypothetical protein
MPAARDREKALALKGQQLLDFRWLQAGGCCDENPALLGAA